MDKELGVRAEGCSLTSLFFGGWKFSVFVRATVPPQLPALTPPTQVARRQEILSVANLPKLKSLTSQLVFLKDRQKSEEEVLRKRHEFESGTTQV